MSEEGDPLHNLEMERVTSRIFYHSDKMVAEAITPEVDSTHMFPMVL